MLLCACKLTSLDTEYPVSYNPLVAGSAHIERFCRAEFYLHTERLSHLRWQTQAMMIYREKHHRYFQSKLGSHQVNAQKFSN